MTFGIFLLQSFQTSVNDHILSFIILARLCVKHNIDYKITTELGGARRLYDLTVGSLKCNVCWFVYVIVLILVVFVE